MSLIGRRARAVVVGVVLAGASALPVRAQFVSGVIGAGAGVATGGYITLSYVVARAQAGHYLHDFHDLFALGSVMVIGSAATGATLGAVAPERMYTGLIYGTTGTVLGGVIGFIGGRTFSDRPEARWAYGAIGAGVGMAFGALIGNSIPNEGLVNDLVPKFFRQSSRVPISVTIKL